MNSEERKGFSGKLGYVLSAAGASVGLGNIWRFPYLAAKYGGGIFLLVYILLALTFGYTMIITETAIGRYTGKSPYGAFTSFGKAPGTVFGGWINSIIPLLICPYYSVIGGWVCKYLFEYIRGNGAGVAQDTFFGEFISNGFTAEFWFIVFVAMILIIIVMGVENGIERVSSFMMPVLIVLAFLICIYSMTRPGAIEGVKYFLVPNPAHFSWMTVISAMGQMFYSLSIAMGILITFGSYMKKDVSIEESTIQVEIFDTGIAVMAGLMIIPAVFSFSGGDPEALGAGPSLMFITMPKIFDSMGFSRIIALTESAVSTLADETSLGRVYSTLFIGAVMLILGSLSCLGYGPLADVKIIGMQFLDFFDFLTNSIMMPIAALCICLFVRNRMTVALAVQEVEQDGHRFHRRKIFEFMIQYVCPVFVVIILVSSVANVLGLIQM